MGHRFEKLSLRARRDRRGRHNPEGLYLDLLKRCLTRSIFPEPETYDPTTRSMVPFDPALRAEGRDWPPQAETMIGLRRLDNLEQCLIAVLERGVPGYVIETGVWRG